MKKANLFRVVFVFVTMFALSCWPLPAHAQRGGGGHGGGGGFHGGGGGGFHGGGGAAFRGGGGFSGGGRSGFGGGRSLGGFRGGNFGGRGFNRGRGGFGWGGRGWGGYGWGGWGWGFGFGWPYWGWGWDYPYGYDYGPGYYGPDPYYYDPYYGSSYYPDPYNGNADPPSSDANAQPNQNGPARSWRPPVPGGGANPNYRNSNAPAVGPHGQVLSVDRMNATPNSSRGTGSIPEHSSTARPTTDRATTGRATTEGAITQASAPLRPEVQRALQRLREMPPFAREREIESDRYRQFSPAEKQILRNGK